MFGESKNNLISLENIENVIYIIRGHKVILDEDLAILYGVETRTLNQAVKRNSGRFPEDFMFQLTQEEINLRSQFVISKTKFNLRSQNVHIMYIYVVH